MRREGGRKGGREGKVVEKYSLSQNKLVIYGVTNVHSPSRRTVRCGACTSHQWERFEQIKKVSARKERKKEREIYSPAHIRAP